VGRDSVSACTGGEAYRVACNGGKGRAGFRCIRTCENGHTISEPNTPQFEI
jgi:hypothetical protein